MNGLLPLTMQSRVSTVFLPVKILLYFNECVVRIGSPSFYRASRRQGIVQKGVFLKARRKRHSVRDAGRCSLSRRRAGSAKS